MKLKAYLSFLTSSLFLIVTLLLASCSENSDKKTSATEAIVKPDTLTAIQKEEMEETKKKYSPDTLEINSIRVNGIPFYASLKQLIDTFGKPDSIVKPYYECGPYSDTTKIKNLKQYWYGESSFHVINDKAEIDNIDFSDGKFTIESFQIKLNKKTTVDDLKKVFPNSVNLSIFRADPDTKEMYQFVRFSPGRSYDSMFFLKFKDNKLISFAFWHPC